MHLASSNRVPRLCHHKASGKAVVRLGGRDLYCGSWHSKAAQAEYDRLIAVFLANGRRMPREGSEAGGTTVVELVKDYWRFAKQHYRGPDGKATSELSCLNLALHELRTLFGRTPAHEFGPLKLKAVREAMVAKGWARRSINIHVGRLKRLFKWAVANERVAPEVYQALSAVDGLQAGRTTARETEPVRAASDADVAAVLPHLTPSVRALVQVMQLTGARVGEVTIMRTGDIDRSAATWLYQPSRHKTQHRGRHRLIPLGPQAQEVLKPFLQADPQAYLFQPAAAMRAYAEARHAARTSPMTPSQQRRREQAQEKPRRRYASCYSRSAVRLAIVRACDAAGVDHWHPHQLRHAAAARIRNEFGLEAARAVLGHAGARITELYAAADTGKAVEVMARVG